MLILTMWLFLIIFICVFMSAMPHQLRVVGGSAAADFEHPYQVSIRYFGAAEHICGGSIIAREWIVTAAHCVDKVSPSSLRIVVGTNRLTGGGTSYAVLEVYVHEEYDSFYVKNDVGILKVEPITYSRKIAPIILDDELIEDEQPCVLSGFGMRFFPGPVTDELQHINLITTTTRQCEKIMHPVDSSQICTWTRYGEGACRYDSGGPLVRKINGTAKQIGIVSWLILCARGYPDVYSRISYYYDWFREKCRCF